MRGVSHAEYGGEIQGGEEESCGGYEMHGVEVGLVRAGLIAVERNMKGEI